MLLVLGCGGGGAKTSDASTAIDATSGAERTDVALSTADGKNLTGFLTTSAQSPAGSPGVILLHQFTSNDEQWGDLPSRLAAAGYRVLTFNLRGHGDSDSYDGELAGLLTDPVAAPADVDAALAYLVGAGEADATRIAFVGTSIGANLAVSAAIRQLGKTYVSFSSRQDRAETFAGMAAAGRMSSVFYLAAENDGVAAAQAQSLHDATTEPRQLEIYTTADHGIAILRNQTNATSLLEAWLAANL